MAKKIILVLGALMLFVLTSCRETVPESSRNTTVLTVDSPAETERQMPELETTASTVNAESWRNTPYSYQDVDNILEYEGLECVVVCKGNNVEVIRNNEVISTATFPEDVDEETRKDILYGYLIGKKSTYYVMVKDKVENPTIEFVEISNEELSLDDNKVHVNGFEGNFPIFKKQNGKYVVFIPNNEDTCNSMLYRNIFEGKAVKEEKFEFREITLDSQKFELSYNGTDEYLMNPSFWRLKVFFNEDETIYSEGRLALAPSITNILTEKEIKRFEGKYDINDFSKIIEEMKIVYQEHEEIYYDSILKT